MIALHRLALHWQILIAITLGIGAGTLSGEDGGIAGLTFYDVYHFLGTMFLNALKMIIVPLIVSSIITGVAGFSSGENLGRIGAKTIGYYLMTSVVAILVGLLMVNLTKPGIVDGKPAGAILNLEGDVSSIAAAVQEVGQGSSAILNLFYDLLPQNIVAAAVENQMLGLITFSLLFGFFITRIDSRFSLVQIDFWQGAFEVMMRITMLIMRFAPLGVFGLVAKTIAATGFAAFVPLFTFFITVTVALALHMFVILPALMYWLGRLRPYAHMRAMSPAILTAFSTASSSATLPINMECLEQRAGVSPRITGLVLPLGATINMDGTALYECAAAIFIAQAYGLDLTFAQQFIVVFTALLTSIGVAGIPAASLVAIGIILTAIGLPLEGIAMLLVTDRILDMMRTAVNIYSDAAGASIIARSEGETTAVDR